MLRLGIVGLPNVGKSTLFNALTSAGVLAANYPFATKDPNVGRVSVPDERLDVLADVVKPQRTVPAAVEFVDIAGLVAGASKGEGLGNKFLANIRETDAIVHVVRCFEDEDVTHVMGKVDPVRDRDVPGQRRDGRARPAAELPRPRRRPRPGPGERASRGSGGRPPLGSSELGAEPRPSPSRPRDSAAAGAP